MHKYVGTKIKNQKEQGTEEVVIRRNKKPFISDWLKKKVMNNITVYHY